MAVNDCINRPTVEEIRDGINAEFSANLLGGKPVLPNSTPDIVANIIAGVHFEVWGDLAKAYSQFFIPSMCCDTLYTFAASIGINPKAPAKAAGFVKIKGIAGAAIPAALEVVSPASQEYQLAADYPNPSVFGADGYAVVYVRAILAGAAGNLVAPAALVTSAAYPNTDSPVELMADGITGGAEEETCDELRARLLAQRRKACVAGNLAFYEQAIRSYPGVTRVCFSGCACQQCCDSALITAYPFMDNVYPATRGVPPKAVADAIARYVFGHPMGAGKGLAPIGAYGQMLCAQPCPVDVHVRGVKPITPRSRELIAAAITEYFASRSCVGETLCVSDLQATIAAALPSHCFASIELVGDCVETVDFGRSVKIGCGQFPVLQSVVMNSR